MVPERRPVHLEPVEGSNGEAWVDRLWPNVPCMRNQLLPNPPYLPLCDLCALCGESSYAPCNTILRLSSIVRCGLIAP